MGIEAQNRHDQPEAENAGQRCSPKRTEGQITHKIACQDEEKRKYHEDQPDPEFRVKKVVSPKQKPYDRNKEEELLLPILI